MVGLLGARELARSIEAGGSFSDAAARFEHRQRATSLSVPSSNKLIFRNIALASPSLGAVRNAALADALHDARRL